MNSKNITRTLIIFLLIRRHRIDICHSSETKLSDEKVKELTNVKGSKTHGHSTRMMNKNKSSNGMLTSND